MLENIRDEGKVIKVRRDDIFFYEAAMMPHPIRTKVIGRPKEEAEIVIKREVFCGKFK